MRLHGLLSWFDEPRESLIACLRGLADAGVDHVVAVDGRYSLFPSESHASDTLQHATITQACAALGMACTLHVPSQPWQGNEVEKRTALFALAHATSAPGDWFWVQDADMVAVKWPADLKERLAATTADVADVEWFDVVAAKANRIDWPASAVGRSMFRRQDAPITVGPKHCHYNAPDGRLLWAGTGERAVTDVLDLSAVVRTEHRPNERPPERQLGKMTYYAARDETGIERGKCDCGEPAVTMCPVRWKRSRIGPVADWQEACESCAKRLEKLSRIRLRQLGVNPDAVSVENRNGRIPRGMAVR
jgi:hypothetical protein